jgi:hypothetical protein
MSGLGRIYPVWGHICLDKLDLTPQKNRSGVKMMNLGPDKLIACKLNTIELGEIKGTTKNNLSTRNHK